MMSKKILLIIFLAFLPIFSASAQLKFSFDGTTAVPEAVKASNTSITDIDYKDGTNSMIWKASRSNPILRIVPEQPFKISNSRSFSFYLHSRTANNDLMIIRFIGEGKVQREAVLTLNFKGWRHVHRSYQDFKDRTQGMVDEIQIFCQFSTPQERPLLFDDIELLAETPATQVVGTHWIRDRKQFTSKFVTTTWLDLYFNPIDIPLHPVTAEEHLAIQMLRIHFKVEPQVRHEEAITQAVEWANRFDIKRNADGTVTGKPVNISNNSLKKYLGKYTSNLERLAVKEDTRELFQLVLDHLLNQGITEGCDCGIYSNEYPRARGVLGNLTHILPSCTPEEKTEVLKLIRWISMYGKLYYPEDTYMYDNNSDMIHIMLPYYWPYILEQDDERVIVRELTAVKRFLERYSVYTHGGGGVFKKDGIGFHHNAHHNSYLNAYRGYINSIWVLKDTPFRIGAESYERIKKGMKTMLVYCSPALPDYPDNRWSSISLCGRSPEYDAGNSLKIKEEDILKLIEVGKAVYGHDDKELLSLYNYFYRPQYDCEPIDLDGFHQFNYSGMGVYRQDDWIAVMRAPTTQLWGTEIYQNANTFGRYQSHGTLDVIYAGKDPSRSGHPMTKGYGGWDWNMISGTTTVHYTDWKELMPNKNTQSKFRQYSEKDFSGALSFGDCGIFSTDFVQSDVWGNRRFLPTNLRFKKTVLAVDGILISLGTNISAHGEYADDMTTATNLFQEVLSKKLKPLIVDNSEYKYKSSLHQIFDNKGMHSLISPAGTGYIVPEGNAPLVIFQDLQRTPQCNGKDVDAPETSVTAAKAWLDHGVKTDDGKYLYIVQPDADKKSLNELGKEIQSGQLFEIVRADSLVHQIHYKPQHLMAYSFFEKVSLSDDEYVSASDCAHLLMIRPSSTAGSSDFAICCPDLKPTPDEHYRFMEHPTTVRLTLKGKWTMEKSTVNVKILNDESHPDTTTLEIFLQDGLPEYFTLKKL